VRQRSSAFRRVDERTAKILGCLVRTEVQDGKGCRTCRASKIARLRTDQVERRGSPVLKVSTTPNYMQKQGSHLTLEATALYLGTSPCLEGALGPLPVGLGRTRHVIQSHYGAQKQSYKREDCHYTEAMASCLCTLGSSGTAQGLVHENSKLGDGSILMYRPRRR
jgi:hypothetical protein